MYKIPRIYLYIEKNMLLELFCSSGSTFLLFLWYWSYLCFEIHLSIHRFFYFSRQETSYTDTEILKKRLRNSRYSAILISKSFCTRNLALKIFHDRESFRIYSLFEAIPISRHRLFPWLPLLFSFVELNLRSTLPQNCQITFYSASTVPIYYFCLAVKETRFGNYVLFPSQAYTDFPFYIFSFKKSFLNGIYNLDRADYGFFLKRVSFTLLLRFPLYKIFKNEFLCRSDLCLYPFFKIFSKTSFFDAKHGNFCEHWLPSTGGHPLAFPYPISEFF